MIRAARTILAATLVLSSIARADDADTATADAPRAIRPVATYSIVARDAQGNLGVAVQSHWFSVGTVVPWARSGVGAVATQSLADIRYGPMGLELMGGGRTAPEALLALTASDPAANVRQVALIDAQGNVAAHTGDDCIAEASHATGRAPDGADYSCQANLMDKPGVAGAMADAFESSTGDLASRLMAALHAAQEAGGDIRGKQSAALLVVDAHPSSAWWSDVVVDLRVDDHDEPLAELDRLLSVHRAYRHMNDGDLALEEADFDLALKHYAAAENLDPDNAEIVFWTAVTLVGAGRTDDALPRFQRAFADAADWREVLRRLPASGLFPDDPKLIERITSLPDAQDSP